MKPIQLKDWVPSEPNREMRRLMEKEFSKLKPLLRIDQAFADVLLQENIDYDLTLGFYKGEYKREVDLILHRNRITLFDINENFIEDKYGYKKEIVKKYDNSVQILEPIRKFINRNNNGN